MIVELALLAGIVVAVASAFQKNRESNETTVPAERVTKSADAAGWGLVAGIFAVVLLVVFLAGIIESLPKP